MVKVSNSFQGKQLLILGLGLSGCSAATFLLSKGAKVTGYDEKLASLTGSPEIQSLIACGLQLYQNSSINKIENFDTVIVSPGVPLHNELYQECLNAQLEIIGEAELALRHLNAPCIGITGTNGKTTVTLLIEHVLNYYGITARAVGNVGVPLTSMIDFAQPSTIFIIELSSFQLETLSYKALDAALLLNISPDHLDRYANMIDYAKAKAKIFDCVKLGGNCFISARCYSEWKKLLTANSLFIYDQEKSVLGELIKTGHELENLLAAYHVCLQWGITKNQFILAQKSFVKPPHRLEFVRNIAGINYIDDSKGTNIDAVIKAIESLAEPIILIAGGVDKGFSYNSWMSSFKGKVRLICAIGEAAEKIHRELSSNFQIEIFDDLEQAVSFAAKNATIGSTVLLSPGCASYDMFRDYTHRGMEFRRIVNSL